jgi:hypothetical protein
VSALTVDAINISGSGSYIIDLATFNLNFQPLIPTGHTDVSDGSGQHSIISSGGGHIEFLGHNIFEITISDPGAVLNLKASMTPAALPPLFTFVGPGQLNITNALVASSGNVTATTGTLNVLNTNPISGAGGAFFGTIGGSGSFTITSGVVTSTNQGLITVTGVGSSVNVPQDLTVTNATFSNTNAGSNSGTGVGARVSVGRTFSLISGSVTNINEAAVTGGGFGSAITDTQNIVINAGSFTSSNTGSVSGIGSIGAFVSASNFTVNGGVVNFANLGPVQSGIGTSLAVVNTLTMNGGLLTNTNSGVITGGFGSLVQAASINLQAGTIVNDANVLANILQIGTAGTYAGSGISGSSALPIQVVNAGVVVPGDPGPGGFPGTMTINGSYTQTGSGDLVINIQNSSSYSKLLISEAANLSGSLELAESPGANILPGDIYTILEANGGVTGTFTTILDFSIPYLLPHTTYLPNSVEVFFTPIAQKYVNLSRPIFSSVNETNLRLTREMGRLRSHFTKPVKESVSASKKPLSSQDLPVHFTMYQDDEPLSSLLDDELSYVEPQEKATEEKRERLTESLATPSERPWNFYVGPKGQIGNVLSGEDSQGYEQWSAGVFTGFDYAFSEVGIGFLAEYERIDARVGKKWGKFTIDNLHADVYATYAPSQLPEIALNAILGGGYEWYTIDRRIATQDSLTMKGTPKGAELDALLGIEYAFRKSGFLAFPQGLQIIPEASIEYMYLHIDDYSEKGTKFFTQHIAKQNSKSLRSNLGFRAQYTWEMKNVTISPEAHFGWEREFLDKARKVQFTPAEFQDAGFSLKIPKSGRNIALAGLDLFVTLFDRHGIDVGYDFEYNSQYHTHFLYMSYNVRF